MKIVILHQHFKNPHTGGAIRSYYLAQALLQHGHSVTVITGHNLPYKTDTINGIVVHWLPVAYDNSFSFYKRSFSFIKFVWHVIMKPELYSDADLCYTISVPLTTGIAALIIKWRKGIQYAFEVGDLWPDAPIEMGLLKNKILQAAALALEKYIYKRSALLVALSTPIKEAMGRKIIFAKKVHVIPNMADTDFYNLAPTAPSTLPFIEGKFVVSYIGAIGYANGLGYLLECARASQRAGLPVVFIICGAGALLPNLEKQAKALQLENLFFVPFQNREGVREILNASQAAMVSYRPVSILETGSPNKFFDGLAAGKLILINFGGWIKEEIETHTCGIYLNQKHPTDFVEKIKPFLKDGQLLKTYQQNARALAVKKYSRDFLSEKFVALVES